MQVQKNDKINQYKKLLSKMRFKQKHTLEERQQKFKKQIEQDKDKILIIAQKHPKSKLPEINPKFLCDKKYKFNMIKTMLEKKVKLKAGNNKSGANESFFVFVGNKIPDGEQIMEQIYDKYKDEDGFLYLIYQDMEDKGGNC